MGTGRRVRIGTVPERARASPAGSGRPLLASLIATVARTGAASDPPELTQGGSRESFVRGAHGPRHRRVDSAVGGAGTMRARSDAAIERSSSLAPSPVLGAGSNQVAGRTHSEQTGDRSEGSPSLGEHPPQPRGGSRDHDRGQGGGASAVEGMSFEHPQAIRRELPGFPGTGAKVARRVDWSGFEPEASGLQNRRSSGLIYQPALRRSLAQVAAERPTDGSRYRLLRSSAHPGRDGTSAASSWTSPRL